MKSRSLNAKWLIILGISISAQSHAFELKEAACKTTSNWTPLYGQCDGQGRLTGVGGAIFGPRLLVKGSFKDGVPDGAMEYSLAKDQNYEALVKYTSPNIKSWGEFISTIGTTNQSDSKSLSLQKFCSMKFDSGQISSNAIECNFSNQYNEQLYQIKPLSGKAFLRNGGIEMDVPNVVIKLSKISGLSATKSQITITGVADELIIHQMDTLMIRGLLGKATYSSNQNQTKGNTDLTVSAEGYFDILCQFGNENCYFAHVPFKPEGGSVDIKYLTKFTMQSGINIQYVSMSQKRSHPSLLGTEGGTLLPLTLPPINSFYYFKTANGVEFDGSAPECGGQGRAQPKGNRRGTKPQDLDFSPICGKVTMPDGRSYAGPFDKEGRPAQ